MKLQKFKKMKYNLKENLFKYRLNFGTQHLAARGISFGVFINYKAKFLNCIFFNVIRNFSLLHKYNLANMCCKINNYLELIYFKDWKYYLNLDTNENVFKSVIVKMLKEKKC